MARLDPDVPRLPRGGGGWLRMSHVVKIAMTAMLLVVVIMFRQPCASATSRFVTSFDGSGSAAPEVAPSILPAGPLTPGPGAAPAPMGELIPLGGSEAEIAAAIEAARARARGSASGSGSGSGSAQLPGH